MKHLGILLMILFALSAILAAFIGPVLALKAYLNSLDRRDDPMSQPHGGWPGKVEP